MKITTSFEAMNLDSIVKLFAEASTDDLRRIRLRLDAELAKRSATVVTESKTQQTQPKSKAKAQPKSKASEAVAEVKTSAPELKFDDRCGSLVRCKNFVLTLPTSTTGKRLSWKYRTAITLQAEKLGGVKQKTGDKVYDQYHADDPYVLVIKFPTTKKAEEFMSAQKEFVEQRKRG